MPKLAIVKPNGFDMIELIKRPRQTGRAVLTTREQYKRLIIAHARTSTPGLVLDVYDFGPRREFQNTCQK